MVGITGTYEGDLRCRARHGPSGSEIETDAPTDNQGQGRRFSPTDLLATSLATCVLTIMGMAARRKSIDIAGARFTATKEMVADPRRRIGRIAVEFVLPASVPAAERASLEAAARGCPVTETLGDRVRVDLAFRYE